MRACLRAVWALLETLRSLLADGQTAGPVARIPADRRLGGSARWEQGIAENTYTREVESGRFLASTTT
jgi:hypothetical protein